MIKYSISSFPLSSAKAQSLSARRSYLVYYIFTFLKSCYHLKLLAPVWAFWFFFSVVVVILSRERNYAGFQVLE